MRPEPSGTLTLLGARALLGPRLHARSQRRRARREPQRGDRERRVGREHERERQLVKGNLYLFDTFLTNAPIEGGAVCKPEPQG